MSYRQILKYNQREREVQEEIIGNGWKILYKGWPDFLCYKENSDGKIEAFFIEVKRTPKQKKKTKEIKPTFDRMLSPEQEEMHHILKLLGFEVKVIYKD